MKSKYIDSTLTKMSELGAEQMQLFPPKTLLMVVRSGILRHTLPLAILRKKSTVNQDIKTISFYVDDVSEFIYTYLLANQSSILTRYAKSGTTVESINFDEFKDIPIPLPSLAEQRRIVEAIESTFAVIDKIERNKTDLKIAVSSVKSKILSLAIRGKLIPQDPSDEPASVLLDRIRAEAEALGKIDKIKRDKGDSVIVRGDDNSYYEKLPDSWEMCHISAIGQVVGGGTPRTDEPSYWDNGVVPWITPADLSGYTEKFIASGSRKITKKGLSESSARLLPKGSILFSSRAPIGYIVIATNEVCTNQGFKSVVPYVVETSEYLYYFLKAQIEEICSRASGTTFKEISGTEMSKTIVFLPPLNEQQRIVDTIETVFEWLDKITENLK